MTYDECSTVGCCDTHDELLAKIDEPNPIMVYETEAQMKLLKQKEIYLLSTFQSLGINPNVLVEQNALITQLKAQIHAVVELHKLQEITLPDGSWGHNCKECDNNWDDCSTIKAIKSELG